jgi:hypothetical protein
MKPKKLFTVKERLAIWRKVRKSVKSLVAVGNSRGLCHLIDDTLGNCEGDKPDHKRPYSNTIHERYPEFFKHKPATAGTYWWDLNQEGMKTRLDVCNKIIKQLEYKK